MDQQTPLPPAFGIQMQQLLADDWPALQASLATESPVSIYRDPH